MKLSNASRRIIEKARNNRGEDGMFRIEPTEVATLLRDRLKHEFPGERFRVRTDRYRGGSSIDVEWGSPEIDRQQVDAICDEYDFCEFDGNIDLETDIQRWLLPSGRLTLARRDGQSFNENGKLCYHPDEQTDCPEPGAVLCYGGVSYVQCHRDPELEKCV